MISQLVSFLGIGRRGGNILLGLDAVEKKPKSVFLIVLSEDASERTVRNAERLSRPCIKLPVTKAELGTALGAGEVAVVGITDPDFAAAFKSKYEKSQRGI